MQTQQQSSLVLLQRLRLQPKRHPRSSRSCFGSSVATDASNASAARIAAEAAQTAAASRSKRQGDVKQHATISLQTSANNLAAVSKTAVLNSTQAQLLELRQKPLRPLQRLQKQTQKLQLQMLQLARQMRLQVQPLQRLVQLMLQPVKPTQQLVLQLRLLRLLQHQDLRQRLLQ